MNTKHLSTNKPIKMWLAAALTVEISKWYATLTLLYHLYSDFLSQAHQIKHFLNSLGPCGRNPTESFQIGLIRRFTAR